MPDFDETRDMIYGIIKKQLDIIELISSAGLANQKAGQDLTQIGRHLTAIYNISSEQVTISNHNDHHEETKVTGDSFSNIGAGAIIVNRSLLSQSLNRLGSDGRDEISTALLKVADLIEKSGNVEASESFNAMTEELNQSVPRKAVLKALWAGVVGALPTISDMADITDKIYSLFN
ncbi:hypothetical protein ACFHWS_27465 [Micromonospora sp. LOL_013]|uniref:hypothetical protein n=1 Tax=unclassified Micromonospora TaxID=2617518 RepID=UPI003A8958F7